MLDDTGTDYESDALDIEEQHNVDPGAATDALYKETRAGPSSVNEHHTGD